MLWPETLHLGRANIVVGTLSQCPTGESLGGVVLVGYLRVVLDSYCLVGVCYRLDALRDMRTVFARRTGDYVGCVWVPFWVHSVYIGTV